MIYSCLNAKGGTGKTITAINLSASLSQKLLEGERVLLIDLDPQSNSTIGLNVDPSSLPVTIGNVLKSNVPLSEAIQETSISNLDLVPSSISLAKISEELYAKTYRERLLDRAIQGLRASYRFIIIDCPPTLSILSVNAVYASDRLIVPCTVSRLSLDGLADLLERIEEIKEGRAEQYYKILLTQMDRRTKVTNEFILERLKPYREQMFETIIMRNEALNQSIIAQKTIFEFDRRSQGAKDYHSLAKEVLTDEQTGNVER